MSNVPYADKWQVWGYPDDPEWDGHSYDIGYTTESGCGTSIAANLDLDDAVGIVGAVNMYRGLFEENKRLEKLLLDAGIDASRSLQ